MDNLESVLKQIEREITRIREEMNDDHRDFQKDVIGFGYRLDRILALLDNQVPKPTAAKADPPSQLLGWQPLIVDVVKAGLQITAIIITGKAIF